MLIKFIKSVLWRVVKCLSYIQDARCLKVKEEGVYKPVSYVIVRMAVKFGLYFEKSRWFTATSFLLSFIV